MQRSRIIDETTATTRRLIAFAMALVALVSALTPARAQERKSLPWPYADSAAMRARGSMRPQDVPDIFGFGKVTKAGNVWLKTTNIGVVGNPYPELSSDPSCQWPGPSGVEYLFYAGLWVGAVDPTTIDPVRRHRVSASAEWRPRSLDPADRIWESFPADPGQSLYVDDDGDGKLDEDPLNGFDDDGDGRVDEDGGSAGDQTFNCVMRDDRPEAIQASAQEAHVPLGLQVRQSTYAFSLPSLRNVTYVQQEIENVSGHDLDSVFVAWLVDQDVGPIGAGRYFADDIPEPEVPQGPDPRFDPVSWDDISSPNLPYKEVVGPSDPKLQLVPGNPDPIPLCPVDTFHVFGFTMTDDTGDGGATPGASTFLLLDHPNSLVGDRWPPHVGFRMYSYYVPGVAFAQGGLPTNDLERYQVISSRQNIDPATGLIHLQRPEIPADYLSLCSVGPFLRLKAGDRIRVVWAITVAKEDRSYPRADRRHRYHDVIQNALDAYVAYRGYNDFVLYAPVPDGGGRESALRAPPGTQYTFADCRDRAQKPFPGMRTVTANFDTWFDLDCNWCTGVRGMTYKHWYASHPPPNPRLSLEPGDHEVVLRWDNFPEYTPDPVSHTYDFLGFNVWKASNWKRPGNQIGPDDSLWELLATYYYYDEVRPLIEKTVSGTGETLTVKTSDILVNRTWLPGNPMPRTIRAYPVPCLRQTGGVLSPDDAGDQPCDYVLAGRPTVKANGQDTTLVDYRVIKYPVGRWKFEDPQVLNGFTYFYSVTAFDSSGRGSAILSLEGRNEALQNDGVVPQVSFQAANNGGKPFVVPNPYRGRAGWDLGPNATDPTGSHIDFMNLPTDWARLRIYTVSGDLVEEIRPTDMRVDGRVQKETTADQEATWNLISRNGQDVVSGIYLFSVETKGGAVQQGRFVVIR